MAGYFEYGEAEISHLRKKDEKLGAAMDRIGMIKREVNPDVFEILTEAATGLQGLVFMQLMSMYTSIAMDIPTDNPSPSGLVNRVVQGVTVYPYPK